MKDCTSDLGHDWVAASFTTKAGSTPVFCARCQELGYRLGDADPVDQEPGLPGEELF